MLPLQHTKKVINSIRQKTDRVILFYSGGKDSLVLLDLLSKEFTEVVCVFMYFVKGLEHCDKYLRFAETYSNVSVLQVPHWILTYVHKSGMYCQPRPEIKLLKLIDIDSQVRKQTGIQWTIYGFKKADSLNRRLMLQGYTDQAINEKTQKAYPLSLWKNGDVLRYIQINRIPKPIQYGNKASNGVSLNLDVFMYLQKYYPGDLKKILKEFPMSGVILFNHERKVQAV